MKTNEMINDQLRVIDWEFDYVYERHDNNWGAWHVEGIDQYGQKYFASCQADRINPENFHAEIEDIVPYSLKY